MIWAAIGLVAAVLAQFLTHSSGWSLILAVAGVAAATTALVRLANALARGDQRRWLIDVAFGAACVGAGVAVLLLASLGPEPKGDAAAMLIAGGSACLFGIAVAGPTALKARRRLADATPGRPTGSGSSPALPYALARSERLGLAVTAVLFLCTLLVIGAEAIMH